jgi:hypothetical protein
LPAVLKFRRALLIALNLRRVLLSRNPDGRLRREGGAVLASFSKQLPCRAGAA